MLSPVWKVSANDEPYEIRWNFYLYFSLIDIRGFSEEISKTETHFHDRSAAINCSSIVPEYSDTELSSVFPGNVITGLFKKLKDSIGGIVIFIGVSRKLVRPSFRKIGKVDGQEHFPSDVFIFGGVAITSELIKLSSSARRYCIPCVRVLGIENAWTCRCSYNFLHEILVVIVPRLIKLIFQESM